MLQNNPQRYAVIMAGGGGTRLWPISRREKPKQFQTLVGDQTLLQMMHKLLLGVFPPDRIFIQSPVEYLSLVQDNIPTIQAEQIVIEPESRDTAPAFAFAAATLAKQDPTALMGIFYSDNMIPPACADIFYASVELAFEAVQEIPESLVMLCVRPRYPHTGLGYVELVEQEHGLRQGVFRVRSFVEKPGINDAIKFLSLHNYLWNTGYKVIRVDTCINLLARSDQAYSEQLPLLLKAVGND